MSDYPAESLKGMPLFEATAQPPWETDRPTFDGVTFDYSQDFERLTRQLDKVAHLMRDGQKRTLRQIASRCGCSESGASARLRDLRKLKFQAVYGSMTVQRERTEEGGGLFVYWIERE